MITHKHPHYRRVRRETKTKRNPIHEALLPSVPASGIPGNIYILHLLPLLLASQHMLLYLVLLPCLPPDNAQRVSIAKNDEETEKRDIPNRFDVHEASYKRFIRQTATQPPPPSIPNDAATKAYWLFRPVVCDESDLSLCRPRLTKAYAKSRSPIKLFSTHKTFSTLGSEKRDKK